MGIWFWIVFFLLVAILLIGTKVYFSKLRSEMHITESDIYLDFYSNRFLSCGEYGYLMEQKLYRIEKIFSVFAVTCWLLIYFVESLFSDLIIGEDFNWIIHLFTLLFGCAIWYDCRMFFNLCLSVNQEIFKLTAKVHNIPSKGSSNWDPFRPSLILPIHRFHRFSKEHKKAILDIVNDEYHAYAEGWLLPEDWKMLRESRDFLFRFQLDFLIEHCYKIDSSSGFCHAIHFFCDKEDFKILRDLRNRDIILERQGEPTRILKEKEWEILVYEIPVWRNDWPRIPNNPEKPDWVIRHLFYIYPDGRCKRWDIEREKDGCAETICRD